MLTSQQRAYLRALGNDEQVIVQIGKGGITDTVVQQVDDALEARELIKIRVLRNSFVSLREATETLCEKTDAHPVQQVGNVALLYRRSENKQHITLPGE